MGRGFGTYNPYTADASGPPPQMAGRDVEQARFQSLINELSAGGTHQHILLTGLRGTGKTSLLTAFSDMCIEANWQATIKEVGRGTHLGELVGLEARKALLRMSTKERIRTKALQALRVLRSFELTLRADGISFGIGVDPEPGWADSGNLAEDLGDVLVAVGEVAHAAGIGFALILDELQYIDTSSYETLIMALNKVNREGREGKRLPIAFVGAGLPLLPDLTGQAKPYAARMFQLITIGALDAESSREALVLPAEHQGIEWESSAISTVLRHSEGYPFFLQKYGRYAWDRSAGKLISQTDVDAVLTDVRNDLDQAFYHMHIGELTQEQQAYVVAMAELDAEVLSSSAVARAMGRAPSGVSRLRDELLRRAVIYAPHRGEVAFTVPQCAGFINRYYGTPSSS